MKYKEIESLSQKELQEKLQEHREQLRKYIFGHTITPLENASVIKKTRKTIARLKTQVRKQELLSQKNVL